MIVTRTPLRVSFLGGGSDYPAFFMRSPGAVIGAAVNLYVYLALLEQTPLSDSRFKLTYRDFESVDDPSQLRHPVVRALLTERGWAEPGIQIATLSDVPARTGLGSSSAFTVGLINALALARNEAMGPEALAREAIRIERDVLHEAGGWQDQYHAAFGGLALYQFSSTGVTRHECQTSALVDGLKDSLVLVPTGSPRASHDFARHTSDAVGATNGGGLAKEMADLARTTFAQLRAAGDGEEAVATLGTAMARAWQVKQGIMGGQLDPDVHSLIHHGLRHGALAGRLCGAGGSGFVLFLTPSGDAWGFMERSGLIKGGVIALSDTGSTHGPHDWMQSSPLS